MNTDRFKFRFYSEDESRYLKNSEIQSIVGLSMVVQTPDDSDNQEQALNVCMPGSIVTEQCTGLKDKNGKLIYDGDILHVHIDLADGTSLDETLVVVWSKVNAGWSHKSSWCEDLTTFAEDSEIVGNIHDPEKEK